MAGDALWRARSHLANWCRCAAEARGQGIAREAQTLLCDYLFKHTIAERIEAVVRTDNTPEHRALEEVEFGRDGILARARFKQGHWYDLVLYSMVRSGRT